ncbi:MAG: hypothetical protein AAFQ79_08520 [Pseudomonadota bacterium]
MKTKKLALAALALTTPSALAAVVFAMAPAPAHAEGCFGSSHADIAMSCAAGTTWDEDKQTCVATPSS